MRDFNLQAYLKDNSLLKESASDLDPKAAARSNKKYAENPRGYVKVFSEKDIVELEADVEMYELILQPEYIPGQEPERFSKNKPYFVMGTIDNIENYLLSINKEDEKIVYDRAPAIKNGQDSDDWMARSGASKGSMKDYDNERRKKGLPSKYSGYYGQGA